MEQAILNLQHLTKSFDGKKILDDLSIDIGRNEFVTLLGPSGCGKTTTLRIIGGFATPDEGYYESVSGQASYQYCISEIFAIFPYECRGKYCIWTEVEEKE